MIYKPNTQSVVRVYTARAIGNEPSMVNLEMDVHTARAVLEALYGHLERDHYQDGDKDRVVLAKRAMARALGDEPEDE